VGERQRKLTHRPPARVLGGPRPVKRDAVSLRADRGKPGKRKRIEKGAGRLVASGGDERVAQGRDDRGVGPAAGDQRRDRGRLGRGDRPDLAGQLRRVPPEKRVRVGIERRDIGLALDDALKRPKRGDQRADECTVERRSAPAPMTHQEASHGVEAGVRIIGRKGEPMPERVLDRPEGAVVAHDEVGPVHRASAGARLRRDRGGDDRHLGHLPGQRPAAHEGGAEVAPRPEIAQRGRIGVIDRVERNAAAPGEPGEEGPPTVSRLRRHRVHPGVRGEGRSVHVGDPQGIGAPGRNGGGRSHVFAALAGQ
jgi:hypothetical protein